jgi:hypothetical protein
MNEAAVYRQSLLSQNRERSRRVANCQYTAEKLGKQLPQRNLPVKWRPTAAKDDAKDFR